MWHQRRTSELSRSTSCSRARTHTHTRWQSSSANERDWKASVGGHACDHIHAGGRGRGWGALHWRIARPRACTWPPDATTMGTDLPPAEARRARISDIELRVKARRRGFSQRHNTRVQVMGCGRCGPTGRARAAVVDDRQAPLFGVRHPAQAGEKNGSAGMHVVCMHARPVYAAAHTGTGPAPSAPFRSTCSLGW